MKTVVLKSVNGHITLGNPLMTKSGVSASPDCITILVHNVPDEITAQQVIKMYESAIIVPQSVFEFDFEKINVAPGAIIWLDESAKPQ